MIRTIADTALLNYDRWYVMAHSLGSVVAFNGLMETSYAWPGYLDRGRWADLVQNGCRPGARRLGAACRRAHASNPADLG